MRYLSRRLAHGFLVLAGVSVLSFVFVALAPGEFLNEMRLDPRISPEMVAALRDRYGLDQPLPLKYLHWLQSVLRGELGFSFAYDRPVAALLWPRARNTLLLEQHPAHPELRLTDTVREQPIMAETLEARGQDMEQEPPDELDGIEGHQSAAVPMGIVFPPQGHPPVLQRQQAPMRDRHAMRIAREILQSLSRTTTGWLGIHHPLRGLEGPQELLPPVRVSERVALPIQPQGALRVRLTEPGEEQPAEHATQHTDRKEEGRSTGSPLRPVE